MKKKVLFTLLALVCALSCLFGITACGKKDDKKPMPHEHTMLPVEEVKPDCTTSGNIKYFVCSGCEKWFSDLEGTSEITDKASVTVAALGHDWNDGTIVPADCTNEGVTTYSCKRVGCNETNVERTPALGHDMDTEWTQSVYTHFYACSRCNIHDNEADHIYTDTNDSVCEVCGNITYDTAFTFLGRKADGTKTTVETEIASYAVEDYTGNRKRVMIPLTYNGKPITEIAAETFMGDSSMVAVSIPRTVTLIGRYAFYGCTALIDVELQGGVTAIGYRAFMNCSNLQNVTLSGKISSLGECAFQNTGIRAIHFPESLTEIGGNAFAQCPNLTEITIPSTVTEVGASVFIYCEALETCNFLASIDTIPLMTFDYCGALKNVTLSNTIKSLDTYSFAYTSIENIDFLPEGLTTIGAKAFTGCTKTKTVKIPSTCTQIMFDAFRSNSALERVTGGGNIQEIGQFAFWNCVELKSIEGVQNLVSIGDQTFYNCESLTSFTFGGQLETIGEKAFQCAAVASVNLGSSVKSVGKYAFANNSNLTEVAIGSGLESVGSFVFWSCTQLRSAVVDSIVGVGMFWDDTALTMVTIGGNEIGESAFHGCTGLTSATFTHTDAWLATLIDEEENIQTARPAVSSTDKGANAALLKDTYVDYTWTISYDVG